MDSWGAAGDDDFTFPADPADLQMAEPALPLLHAGNGPADQLIPFHLLAKLPTSQLPRTVMPRVPAFGLGSAAVGLLSARANLRGTLFRGGNATAADAPPPPAGAAAVVPAADGVAGGAPAQPAATSGTAARAVPGSSVHGWTPALTTQFLDALSQFGTDFSSIAVFFPGRTRAEIIHKYKQELRHNNERVMQALATQKPIDVDRFVQCKKQAEAANEEPARKLNDDELVFLHGLRGEADAAVPAAAGAAVAATAAPGAVDPDEDFSFDMDAVPLSERYSPAVMREMLPLSELYASAADDDVAVAPKKNQPPAPVKLKKERKKAPVAVAAPPPAATSPVSKKQRTEAPAATLAAEPIDPMEVEEMDFSFE